MPRKPKSEVLPYGTGLVTSFSPADISPETVTLLSEILARKPTEAFLRAYSCALGAYYQLNGEYPKMRSRATMCRLSHALKKGEEFLIAIGELHDNDHFYISDVGRRRLEARQLEHGEAQSPVAIELYISNLRAAVGELGGVSRRGNALNIPKRALALDIADAIFCEIGKFPARTKGGIFDRILKQALDSKTDMRDVMDSARECFDEADARAKFEQFRDVSG